MITVIGIVAVIVAVFGHPTQTVAAAVIVTSLGALAGGGSPPGTTEALKSLTRILPSLGRSALEHVIGVGGKIVSPDQLTEQNAIQEEQDHGS